VTTNCTVATLCLFLLASAAHAQDCSQEDLLEADEGILGNRETAIFYLGVPVADHFVLFDPGSGDVVCQFTDIFTPRYSPAMAGIRARQTSALTWGTTANPALIADLNGDGIPDIANDKPGAVQIYLGAADSSGNLTYRSTPVTYPVPVAQGTQPVIVSADFNGDGIPDLAVGNGSADSVSVLLGTGDGTFQTQQSLAVGSIPSGIAAADLNHDGFADLVVYTLYSGATLNPQVTVFLGKGDGTFQPGNVLPATGGQTVIGDFNGDGNPDLMVAGYDGGLQLLLGNGGGGFGAAITVAGSASLGRSSAVAYGDFNGDGNLDVATLQEGNLSVYFGTGGGSFAPPVIYICADALNLGMSWVDGRAVFVTTDSVNGIIDLAPGNPDGTFQAPRAFPGGLFDSGFNSLNEVVLTGDFNSDGKQDVVNANVVSGSGTLAFLPGGGDGTLGGPVLSNAAFTGLVIAGDFNGDGKLDVIGTAAGGIGLAAGAGNGTFAAPAMVASNLNLLAAADFNGDGKFDLVAGSSTSGAVTILLSNGSGAFTQGHVLDLPDPVYSVTAADVNGDGKPDLILASYQSNTFYISLNQGGGNFSTPSAYPAGAAIFQLATGDVNGDGKPDLVLLAGSTAANKVGVLLGNGDGTFQSVNLFDAPFGTLSLTLADYNGDGRTDVVAQQCCGQTAMALLLANADGTLQPGILFPGGYSLQAAATADFNGDGKPDLAVVSLFGPLGLSALDAIMLNTFPSPAAIANAASFAGNATVAPNSIAAAFGKDLANATQAATGALATTLAGTTVSVTDSAGTTEPAPLFFASPGQVNFAVPGGLAAGSGQIQITSGDGTVSQGLVQIAPVEPGLFALTGNLAAALSLTVSAQGRQTYADTFQINSSGALVAAPIQIASAPASTYLILYGTGIRGAALSQVSVQVGTTALPPAYAGPASFTGEDQVNVQLPPSLAGAGNVTVTLTANGIASNPFSITIQ
jgi:uncharacterized protein (TIGR03437 family)